MPAVADRPDMVSMDTTAVEVSARSRRTKVGGLTWGHREVMHTEAIHFDKGLELNGFGWVANIWEAQMVHEFGKDLICDAMKMWVTGTKERWPDTHFVTFGEFGELWRKQYKSNDDWNYRFVERGSGLGDSYNNLEIKWFMNKEFLGLIT